MDIIETVNQFSELFVDQPGIDYIQAAASNNTRFAYHSDIKHFLEEGGVLPSDPQNVVAYLKRAALALNPRTLKRRLTAIRQWYKLKGEADPTDNPLVVKTMKGISRLHSMPAKQAAALKLEDLDKIISSLNEQSSLASTRNKAMLLVGFFGALHRSELIALTWEDIRFKSDGVMIRIPRSKTDQSGEGAHCAIRFGNEHRCPVRALIE